jgi:alkylation response protein AidB-like acyl-CoA dehydrogenase
MELDLPPEAEAARAAVREFLTATLGTDGRPPPDWFARLAAAGYSAPHWPPPWGLGASPAEQLVIDEELRRAGVGRPENPIGIGWAGPTLVLAGTDEQQRRWLPGLLDGSEVWCQLFSEPGAGSDLAGLTTKATQDGDVFVVTGQKVWTSGASISEWGILLARTDPDVAKHKGISFFLLDMSLPGIETRPLRQMTGESDFDEVFLDEVRVPADCLIGPLHGGWGVAMATLTNERGFIGASAVALGRRLDAVPVPADAVRRDEVMRLVSEGRALQRLAQRQGPVASVASSLVKLGLAEMALPFAIATGSEASIVQAPGARLGGGTSEVQRNIIGELILGLPKEPRP